MRNSLIESVEKQHIKTAPPEFSVGDTVDVHVRIVEGEKTRVQIFSGTVIARQGKGVSESFIVRRIVNNEGVERRFPIHSPSVVSVDVIRSGYTRRSKLFFLRDRVGKAVRLREKWVDKKKKSN